MICTSPMRSYRGQAAPLLAMPRQDDDVGSVLSLWLSARDKRNQYEALRRDAMQTCRSRAGRPCGRAMTMPC